ncbi:hypothetical protein EON66_11285 [archaeon]|nr:MAG: hypothetical protein EON66_11285 [archaeon]
MVYSTADVDDALPLLTLYCDSVTHTRFARTLHLFTEVKKLAKAAAASLTSPATKALLDSVSKVRKGRPSCMACFFIPRACCIFTYALLFCPCPVKTLQLEVRPSALKAWILATLARSRGACGAVSEERSKLREALSMCPTFTLARIWLLRSYERDWEFESEELKLRTEIRAGTPTIPCAKRKRMLPHKGVSPGISFCAPAFHAPRVLTRVNPRNVSERR